MPWLRPSVVYVPTYAKRSSTLTVRRSPARPIAPSAVVDRKSRPVRQSKNHLASPEHRAAVRRRIDNHLMAAGTQPLGDTLGHCRLQVDAATVHLGLDEEPRSVERLLRRRAVVHERRYHLQVALRLHGATHHAERAPQRPVASRHHPGNDGVIRPPAGRERVRVPCVEREPTATILKRKPEARRYDPRAERREVR